MDTSVAPAPAPHDKVSSIIDDAAATADNDYHYLIPVLRIAHSLTEQICNVNEEVGLLPKPSSDWISSVVVHLQKEEGGKEYNLIDEELRRFEGDDDFISSDIDETFDEYISGLGDHVDVGAAPLTTTEERETTYDDNELLSSVNDTINCIKGAEIVLPSSLFVKTTSGMML